MSVTDWLVLTCVLLLIIGFGIYKSRVSHNLEGYFLSNRSLPWYLVLMSIMGTQASAITYLSGPGQAYSDGLRFVQYYFGLPLAMIVISVFFMPVFNRLKVFTAYEFLENRFDLKTRSLTSFLFLLSRGLSTGISIYAPSLVLSALMGWNIYITNIVMGGILIIYTISGGAKAVAYTQGLQMIFIFLSMFVVGYMAVKLLPQGINLKQAISDAGDHGKMNFITSGIKNGKFDWKDKYNIWSGLIGGFFLALSYFGTDHSQVGRYLTAKNNSHSRKSLLLNGLVKIPMQYFVLLIGVLIFSFYLYNKAPIYFDPVLKKEAQKTVYGDSLRNTEVAYEAALAQKDTQAIRNNREHYRKLLGTALPGREINDNNYIFLSFVKDNLPVGLVGLLFAMIFLAAWGSIAAALNSLAACSMVDFHQKFSTKDTSQLQQYRISQWYTFAWGIFCIIIAMFANNIGNSLIESVNILGSLFYGVILGIFLVAFWIKPVKANAVFIASLLTEVGIITIYRMDIISFLWLNVIGALGVIIISLIVQLGWNTFNRE